MSIFSLFFPAGPFRGESGCSCAGSWDWTIVKPSEALAPGPSCTGSFVCFLKARRNPWGASSRLISGPSSGGGRCGPGSLGRGGKPAPTGVCPEPDTGGAGLRTHISQNPHPSRDRGQRTFSINGEAVSVFDSVGQSHGLCVTCSAVSAGCEPPRAIQKRTGVTWRLENLIYGTERGAALGRKAGQTHFPGCSSSSQRKGKLGSPLPCQYALELLTIYAWERGGQRTDFITAQGFQSVLELVLNHRKLCIHWTKYYDTGILLSIGTCKGSSGNPGTLTPQGLAPLPTGPRRQRGALEMRAWEAPRLLVIRCCQSLCQAPYCHLI